MRPGVKLLLPAFERAHDERGVPDMQRTAFHVPYAYARDTAKRHAAYFEWAASIHPYRRDAVEALQKAKGEDYPLPGVMPIFSVDYPISLKLLAQSMGPLLREKVAQSAAVRFRLQAAPARQSQGARRARVRDAAVLRERRVK